MNQFKHAKWWRSYLDKLWKTFWKLKFMKNQSLELHSLCQSRPKYARKEQRREEKQSEENRGQQLQSSFTLLEYLPKSIFYILYTISKLRKSRIQHFKPCMIWSWNEEDMAFARQLHPAEGQIRILRIWNSNMRKWFCNLRTWSSTCENGFQVAKSTCEIFASHHAKCETGIFVHLLF